MRLFPLSLLIVAFAGWPGANAGEPPDAKPEIRLPTIEAAPEPKPGPVAVTKLNASQLYIIDSSVELQVVASRDGFVTITAETGPLRIKGVFVDDPTGKASTRSFKGPFLYSVEVVKTGTVELLIFKDVKTPAIRRTLDVDAGQGPQPPPKPIDPPAPVTSFRVIIVRESGTTHTKEQISVMDGKAVEGFLRANCTTEGQYEGWRRYDPQQVTADETPTMKALWAAVQPKITATPCFAVEVNGKVDIIPLAATPEAMVAILKKYKEGK